MFFNFKAKFNDKTIELFVNEYEEINESLIIKVDVKYDNLK